MDYQFNDKKPLSNAGDGQLRKALSQVDLLRKYADGDKLKTSDPQQAQLLKQVIAGVDSLAVLLPTLKTEPTKLDMAPVTQGLIKLAKQLAEDQEVTKAVNVAQFEKVTEAITNLHLSILKQNLKTDPNDPTDYLNVRLTDGEDFYNAVRRAIAGIAESASTSDYLASDGVTPARPVLNANGTIPTTATNVVQTFRSGFAATGQQPDPTDWTLVNDTAGTGATDHIVTQGGNSSGSSYLRISLSPFLEASQVSLISVPTFNIPIWPRFGVSISQRISGQEIFAGVVGVNTSGVVETTTSPADVAITGATATIAANVATFTITNHGFHGGDRVNIYGCAEPRLNVGPVVVTIVDANNITVPCTLANGSYSTTGGMIKYSDPLVITSGNQANNGGGFLWENTTVTNASIVARRNGAQFRSTNQTTGTTTATQSNTSPYTDAFNAAANNELLATSAEFSYRSFATDGIATPTGLQKYTQGLPDETKAYKIFVRARTSKGFTLPIARITNISKSGTTTATVTTDVPHGLTTSSQIQVYGVLNQTDFPNLAAQTVVASVIDANNFTVVIGATIPTVSSSGGTVFSVQGSGLAPGVFAQVVQSVSCTSNVMTFIGSATWATPLPGEYVQVHGMTGSAQQYEGAYKVLAVSTTSLAVAAPGVADFGSIGTGGTVMRRTDVRLHFVQVLDYNPLLIEGGRGNATDINNSLPVSITGGAISTLPTLSTVTTVSTVTSQTQMSGFVIKDTLLNAMDDTDWADSVRGRIT